LSIFIITSCWIFEDDHTSYTITILNDSSDTLRIVIISDSLSNQEMEIYPWNKDASSAYMRLYNEEFYDEILPPLLQEQFNALFDSAFFYIKVGQNWEEKLIPAFWDIDNWRTHEYSDDFYCTHRMYFDITDSLLNLEE